MVRFGEAVGVHVLDGHMALDAAFPTCRPSVAQGSLSLNHLVPAFGAREKELHRAPDDCVDTGRVYKPIYRTTAVKKAAKKAAE
jgi:hypothetical protein